VPAPHYAARPRRQSPRLRAEERASLRLTADPSGGGASVTFVVGQSAARLPFAGGSRRAAEAAVPTGGPLNA